MQPLLPLGHSEFSTNLLHVALTCTAIVAGMLAARWNEQCNISGGRRTADGIGPAVMLCTALLLGFALRLYGINFGLPDTYHPDEFEEAELLVRMMHQRSVNPHYNQQPPLILYMTWPISLALGFVPLSPEYNVLVRTVLAGRILNLFLGTASIYLVFCIGRRLFSAETGAFAALLLAGFPLHVTNSRYMKTDVIFIFFALSCALMVLKAVQDRRYRLLYVAGLMGGFAAGSKYTGMTCAAILMSAPWLASERVSLKPERRLLTCTAGSLAMMTAGFFAVVSYALTSERNFQSLLAGIRFEARHAAAGHLGLAIDPWSQLWMFHISRSIIPGMQLAPFLASLMGMGFLLYRFKTRGLWLIALLMLFFVPAEAALSKPPPQPDRYVTICLPFLALLCAEFARSIAPSRRSFYVVAWTLALLPFARSTLLATEITYDTRRQMREWMFYHLPEGTRILTSGAAAYLPRVPLKFHTDRGSKVIGRDKSNIIERLQASSYDYLLMTSLGADRFSVANIRPELQSPKIARVREAKREIDSKLPVVIRIAPRWGSYGFHNPVLTLYALRPTGPDQRKASGARIRQEPASP